MTPGTAVVTGGASGIGLAIVRRLAAEGTGVVVVVDVDEGSWLRATKSEWRPEPGVAFVRADVSEPAAWEAVTDGLDRVDVAFLNAGVTTGEGSILELTDSGYRRILGVNVDGVVFGVRALLPLMPEGGAFVVTASLAGLVPAPPDPIYALTKHALIGFVRSVAPQLGEQGVRINALCPGFADTPLLGAEGRAALEAAGFPVLATDEVAEAALIAAESGATGQAWVCQPGREPLVYEFRGVPGPRVPGAEGVRPPI